MSRSDHVARVSHWLGEADPRPLALFRIGLGMVLLQDALMRLPMLHAFLTDDGILPRKAIPGDWGFTLFRFTGSAAAVGVVYALGVLAILAFLLGYRTRVATVACWLFFMSLGNRNRELALGGDYLSVTLLFWSIFAQLGACWSVDAEGARPARVPAFGLRLLQYTPALVYLHAARYKVTLGGGGWLHGASLYQTMQLTDWIRPAGAWLGQYPELCALMGDGVLFMEFLFPLLVLCPIWVPATRALAIAINVALQLGILVTMRVGVFTDVMLVASVLYLQPAWLDRAAAALGDLSHAHEAPGKPRSRAGLAIMALVFVLFAAHALRPAAARRYPVWASRVLSRLGLELMVDLYSHGYAVESWHAAGELPGGREVDLLPVAAPGLISGPGWRFSRWTSLVGRAGVHFDELAQYLCRQYQSETGSALQSLRLWSVGRPPHVPGQPVPAAWTKELVHARCAGATR